MSIRIIKTEKANEHNLIARAITKNPSDATIAPSNNFINVESFLRNLFEKNKWGAQETFRTGRYTLLGWEYDFRPYLNKYWYEQERSGELRKCYCINKKLLRKMAGCRVSHIVEIEKN